VSAQIPVTDFDRMIEMKMGHTVIIVEEPFPKSEPSNYTIYPLLEFGGTLRVYFVKGRVRSVVDPIQNSSV